MFTWPWAGAHSKGRNASNDRVWPIRWGNCWPCVWFKPIRQSGSRNISATNPAIPALVSEGPNQRPGTSFTCQGARCQVTGAADHVTLPSHSHDSHMTGWSAKYHRESYYGVINGRTLLGAVYRHQTRALPRSLWAERAPSLWLHVSGITWLRGGVLIGPDTPVTACNWGRLRFALSRSETLFSLFLSGIHCAWAVFTLLPLSPLSSLANFILVTCSLSLAVQMFSFQLFCFSQSG